MYFTSNISYHISKGVHIFSATSNDPKYISRKEICAANYFLSFLRQMTQSYAGGLDQLNSLDRILVCEHEFYDLSLDFVAAAFLFVCLLIATNDK